MELRILSAAEVVQALPMAAAIEGMKTAFAQLSAGQTTVPARVHVEVRAAEQALGPVFAV